MPEGAILKDSTEVKDGDMLLTKLHKGEILSRVEETLKESGQ
jgi:ribosomal 50S subunit-recycling heat shock protein